MPGQELNSKTFIYIAEGNWCQKVPEDHPAARRREWSVGSDSGVKFERVFLSWTGVIVGIRFPHFEWGDICNIELEDAVLSLPLLSRYFSTLAARLPNADLTKEIRFHPYSMDKGKDKKNMGVSLIQNEQKLPNFYWDDVNKKPINGMPLVDESAKDKKGYWQFYFSGVAEFLKEQMESLEIPNKYESSSEYVEDQNQVPPTGPDDQDLPF